MKVVVTAQNFTSFGSTAEARLRAAGLEVEVREDLGLSTGAPEERVAALAADADFVIAGLEPYTARVLDACPRLKLISRRGIGYDAVDTAACRQHGVALARITGAVEGAVAEHVLAELLYFARRLDLQNASVQSGAWERMLMPGAKGSTLGLIGFGGIGKEIARRAVPFGMKVLYYCRHPDPAWEREYNVRYAPLEELLQQSDYVSLNVPATKETALFMNSERLSLMRPGAVLINTARSSIVDTEALAEALRQGRLGGAAVDVFPQEPCTGSPLIGCPNTLLTPHTAPYTRENFAAMNAAAARNVLDFISGCLDPHCRVV